MKLVVREMFLVGLVIAVKNVKRVLLDFVRPLSLGGEHTAKNLQASHLKCNSSKGNTGVGQLRLFAYH